MDSKNIVLVINFQVKWREKTGKYGHEISKK